MSETRSVVGVDDSRSTLLSRYEWYV